MQMEAWPDAQTVIQAEQRALVCEQAWERYGRRIVTDEEVEKVEADLKAVDRQLSQLHSWVWAATMLKFAVYCVIEAVYWVFEVTGGRMGLRGGGNDSWYSSGGLIRCSAD